MDRSYHSFHFISPHFIWIVHCEATQFAVAAIAINEDELFKSWTNSQCTGGRKNRTDDSASQKMRLSYGP